MFVIRLRLLRFWRFTDGGFTVTEITGGMMLTDGGMTGGGMPGDQCRINLCLAPQRKLGGGPYPPPPKEN